MLAYGQILIVQHNGVGFGPFGELRAVTPPLVCLCTLAPLQIAVSLYTHTVRPRGPQQNGAKEKDRSTCEVVEPTSLRSALSCFHQLASNETGTGVIGWQVEHERRFETFLVQKCCFNFRLLV